MRKILKKIRIIGVVSIISICCFSLSVVGQPVLNNTEYSEDETIEPRTDIKKWVYKLFGNNLYKRLYNYSTGHWESDWIFVASGVEEG